MSALVTNASNNANTNGNGNGTFRVLKLHIVVPSTAFHCHENVPVGDSVASLLSYFRTQFGLRGRDNSYTLFLDRRRQRPFTATYTSADSHSDSDSDSDSGTAGYCLLIRDGKHDGTTAEGSCGPTGGRPLAVASLDILADNDRIIVAAIIDAIRPKAHPRLLGTAAATASTAAAAPNAEAVGSVSSSSASASANASASAGARVASCYSAWRDLAHDGNDYYRAAMFAILENILESPADEPLLSSTAARHSSSEAASSSASSSESVAVAPLSRRKLLLLQLVGVFDRPTGTIKWTAEELASRKRFVKLLQNAADNKIWLSIRDLEIEWVGSNDNLDATLVRCARLVTAEYLVRCADDDIGGMRMKDAILAVYSDCRDVDRFCEWHVRRMGSVADGIIVDLNVLGKALSSHISAAAGDASSTTSACNSAARSVSVSIAWNINVVRDISDPIPYLRDGIDTASSEGSAGDSTDNITGNVVLFCGEHNSFHIMYVNSSQLYDEHVDVFDEREYIVVNHKDSVSAGVIEDPSRHADDGVVIVAKGGGSGFASS